MARQSLRSVDAEKKLDPSIQHGGYYGMLIYKFLVTMEPSNCGGLVNSMNKTGRGIEPTPKIG